MNKSFIHSAAWLGAFSVALGAFGAHGLRGIVSDLAVATFETGVRYQFYHVFGLLFLGILYKEFGNSLLQWAGRLFIAGIILFSGSLYVLTFLKAAVIPGYNWIGAITPIGGIAFIAGWILLFFGVVKGR